MDDQRSESGDEARGLEEAVVRFALQASTGEPLDLDDYCAGFPEAWREELRERCLEVQRLRSDLPKREAPATGAFPPERIHGYRIARELGRGGMGVVFLAHPEDGGAPVAIKVLLINALVTTRAVQRFRREMEATRRLDHPGIVPVLEVGEEAGYLYIVMEYVPGPSLARRLAERAEAAPGEDPKGFLSSGGASDVASPNARAAAIAAALADALHEAHEHGLIHRDVKPANILFDAKGDPRLFDFGLAKDLSEDSLSLEGELAGTPSYMSPEQALGKRVVIDRRTDVFSLGVVLYEMLAGQRPFGGDTLHELFYAISFKEPPDLGKLRPDLPRDLVTIAVQAMEKDPDHRFQTAREMAEDLRRFLNHESIVARPVGRVRSLARRARSRPGLSTAVGLLGVLLLSLPFLLEWWGTRSAVHAAVSAANPFLSDDRPWRADEFAVALRAAEREQELARLVTAGVEEARPAWEALRQKRLELVGLLISLGQVADPPPSAIGVRSRRLQRPLYALLASLLSGEDAALAIEQAFYARLSLTSEPIGARVSLRYIERDGSLSEPNVLGVTPLELAAFDPGHIRILVEAEDFGYAELTRFHFEPGRAYTEAVVLRPTAEVVGALRRVPPGDFVSGTPHAPQGSPIEVRTMAGEGFYVMQDEVSCRQYRAFLLATGEEQPRIWPEPYDPTWDDRPACGISFDEARACAEWLGMRLPTVYEHQRMARGTDGRLHPDGIEPPDFTAHALTGERLPSGTEPWESMNPASDELRREYLLRNLQLIGTGPLEGPSRLRHLLGNVTEWTETPDSHGERTATLHDPPLFFFCGGDVRRPSFDFEYLATTDRSSDAFLNGFRCVKSLRP